MKISSYIICILCFCINIIKGNSQDSSPGSTAKKMCETYVEDAKKKEFFCPTPVFSVIRTNFGPQLGDFPHMVEIGYAGDNGTKWLCSGSIISKNYVLTTARCVVPKSKEAPIIVRAGVVHHEFLEQAQERSIDSITVHPQFKPPVKYNDIALIKIKDGFELNRYVYPACLYTNGDIPKTVGYYTGWGGLSYDDLRLTEMVSHALVFDNNENCNKSYSYKSAQLLPQGIVDDSLVCAGRFVSDECQCDIGGPIQIIRIVDKEEMEYCLHDIIGISSFGSPCLLSEVFKNPAVFTRVSYYIQWIEDIVWPQE